MAILHEQKARHTIYLGALHLFGRDRSRSDTVLSNADASQLHASIRWSGAQWELVDHSRHGTLINGRPVAPNARVALAVGQTIRFGPAARENFDLVSLDAPRPMLLPLGHGQAPVALDTRHAPHFLPDEAMPEASVHLAANGQWLCEDSSGCTILRDGDSVQAAGQRWRFFNRPVIDATTDAAPVLNRPAQDACFHFGVSEDGKQVQLAITTRGKKIHLAERTHHECLLALARRRFQDASQGFGPSSQGWTDADSLAAMLGVEANYVNMLLHRARHQIATECAAEPLCSHCVERRRGEVRFACFAFQIQRGCTLEAAFTPPLAMA